MSAPMPPDAGASCALGAPLADSNASAAGVCLGPGTLCPGGRFVGGSGSKPVCEYDANVSGYAVLLTIISILMVFERLKHWLMRTVPRSYMPVMHAMFGELSALGFVSLVAFLFEFEPEGSSSVLDGIGHSVGLGHEIHYTFVRLHFLLFGVSVGFICLCLFILFANLRHNRPYKVWSEQLEAGTEVLHLLPQVGEHEPETRWMHAQTIKDKKETFLRLFMRFTDPETISRGQVKIPPNFNLGHYLTLQSSHVISSLIQIEALDWFVIVLLAGIQFFAWYLSAIVGGPDGGLLVFCFFDLLMLVAALIIDCKLHWIVCQLIPVLDNHKLDTEISVRGSVKSLLEGAKLSVTGYLQPKALRMGHRCTTFVPGSYEMDRPLSRLPSNFSRLPSDPVSPGSPSKAAPPTHKGMMRKRGRINSAYQDRFFVLADGTLTYYDSERAYAKGCRAKGSMNVSAANLRSQQVADGARREFEWVLHDEVTGRTLECACFSAQDRDKWLQIITAHCKGQRMTTKPICQGVMRKRGRVNTAYQDRFFVLSRNGSLNYYESSTGYHIGLAPLGSIFLHDAVVWNGKPVSRETLFFTGPTGWEWSVIEEKTQRNLVLMCDTREQAERWMDAMEIVSQSLTAPQAKDCPHSDTDRMSESEPEETRAGAVKRKVSEVMSQVSRILWQQSASSGAPRTRVGADEERRLGERGSVLGVKDRKNPSKGLGVAEGAKRVGVTGGEDTTEDCDDGGRRLVPTKGATEIGEDRTAWEGGEAEMGRTISNAPTAFLNTKEGRTGGAALSNLSQASSAVREDIAQLELQIARLESPGQESEDAGAEDAAFHSTRRQGAEELVTRSPSSAEEKIALECEALLRQLDAKKDAHECNAAARTSQNAVETSDVDDCRSGWSINHTEGLSAQDGTPPACAEEGDMSARVWAEDGPGGTGVRGEGRGASADGPLSVSVPTEKDAAGDWMSARDSVSGPLQRSSVSSRADSERTPRYSATSTPLSIPDHIDLTPDTFAAALSEVQLALEIMDPHSTGVAAPQSWHGRAVKRSSGDEEMDLGLAEGRDNDEGLHVRGQNFGSSDEIRLEVDHENKVGDSDEQNHAADKDAARPKNQISSKMRKYILNRSWRAGADSTEGADVNSSTKGAIGRATAFSATIAARRHSAFGSTARRGSKAFGSTVGRKARSGPLGALIDADDSMEIHFLNAEEARQVMRRMVPRYVSLLWTDNRSPWRKRMGGSCLNQHQKLFWFEKNGPKSLLRLIRYLLLGSVVMLTITLEVYREMILCHDNDEGSCDINGLGVFLIILALLPSLLSVLLLTRIISKYVLATSIELMKSQETILKVVQDSKAKSTARLFNTLMLISSIIEQINRLSNLAAQAAKMKMASSQGNNSGNKGQHQDSSAHSKHQREKEKQNAEFFTELRAASQKLRHAEEANADAPRRGSKKALRHLVAATTPLRQMLKTRSRESAGGIPEDDSRHQGADYTAHLSKHQLQVLESYQEMFDMADTAGVGELNAEAFLEFLQSTGAVVNAEQALHIFAIADIDNSGSVSWPEFAQVMAAEMRHSTPEGLAQTTWHCFDPHDTGQVTSEQAVEHLEKLKPGMDFADVEELIHTVDIQRKGYITQNEYILWVEGLIHDGSLKLDFRAKK